MIGYKLTPEQSLEIHDKFFSDETKFNVVYDINGVPCLFITEYDVTIIEKTEYSWVLLCDKEDFILPVNNEVF